MKFIVVLSTVFFASCFFSVLNVGFSDRNRQNSDIFYQTETALLNNKLTDEKILRCQNFSDKIIKEFNQKLTEEELQNHLSRCRVFLQQNSKRFGSKDKNDTTRLPPFENYKSQEHYYSTEQHSTAENSKQVNGKNTGPSDKSRSVPVTKLDEGNLIEKPTDKSKNQQTESDSAILNSNNTNWSLWNYLFGGNGSSINSSSVTDRYERSVRNPTEKLGNQKTESDIMILSSTDTSWSLWNYLFVNNDPSKSSNENRSFENFERNPGTEPSINLENPIDLKYLTTEIAPLWNIIMPGTKWCGSGNIAVNDEDLGYFEDVDRCCRAHDKCNDIIPPGESKYNLTNTSPFTVLNCKCDDELYDCLGQIDSVASNTVGNTFFNIFARMCYMLDYPRICKKYHAQSGCLEYVTDKTAAKIYQWKPAKKYLKMPFTISG